MAATSAPSRTRCGFPSASAVMDRPGPEFCSNSTTCVNHVGPSGSWARVAAKRYALVAEARAEGRVVCKVWVHVQDVAVLASER